MSALGPSGLTQLAAWKMSTWDEACVSDPRWNVMDRDDPVEDHNDDKNKQSESKVIQEGIAQPIQNGNFASGPGTSIEIGQKDCESYVRYWGHSVKRDSPIYRREIVIPLKLKDASKPTCRPCSRRTTPFEF